MSYWRTTSQFEVDLLLDDSVAIEIKSAAEPSKKHLKGLRALAEEGLFKTLICVHLGSIYARTEDGIVLAPYRKFLTDLWDDKII